MEISAEAHQAAIKAVQDSGLPVAGIAAALESGARIVLSDELDRFQKRFMREAEHDSFMSHPTRGTSDSECAYYQGKVYAWEYARELIGERLHELEPEVSDG